ncbi:crossover junction endonuclease EME1-like isoform X4 [Ostrea edulis]|uniref:crossover junction endonuclease EME1-like isoform X4 n=1 Tax=Ostrea edulis TaxID=37623 RepID=UPI0024AEA144|nr:crossover junction endonuclease EME1-like isoform X4 [Ostrea edulis]
MNLDDSIAQISSMCPSYTYDEIKYDLCITNNAELTVNRLLDKSISDEAEAPPVMDFSSEDEELPQVYKPTRLTNRETLSQANVQQQIPRHTTSKTLKEKISIILDSDEDEITDTFAKTNGPPNRVNHSMSDSSDEEPCLPSLKDRLSTVCSSTIHSKVSSLSHISRTVTTGKEQHTTEKRVYQNALSFGSLNSKFHSNEELSEELALSDCQNTERSATDNESQSTVSISQSSECSVGEISKRKRTREEIAIQKKEAEIRKRDKKKAREEKVLSKELEKQRKEQIRIAERERKKQMGGSKDCLQYIVLVLDTRIVNSGGHGVAIFKACEALGVQYITQEQTVPFSITWNRQVTSVNISEGNQVETVKSEVMEEDVLVLLPVADFVKFVQNHKKSPYRMEDDGPTLTSYVHTVKQYLPDSILSFIVIGMEKYFRDQKTQFQRKHRAAVLTSEKVDTSVDSGSVTRLDVEEAITENQLETDVMVFLLETSEELAEFVRTFSKAVAEKPAN